MQGRYITVLRHKDKWYAIDSLCYHAGGPLVRIYCLIVELAKVLQ
jgi:nitrite reductase/ring-hydroxylating ferredoxin subunit